MFSSWESFHDWSFWNQMNINSLKITCLHYTPMVQNLWQGLAIAWTFPPLCLLAKRTPPIKSDKQTPLPQLVGFPELNAPKGQSLLGSVAPPHQNESACSAKETRWRSRPDRLLSAILNTQINKAISKWGVTVEWVVCSLGSEFITFCNSSYSSRPLMTWFMRTR